MQEKWDKCSALKLVPGNILHGEHPRAESGAEALCEAYESTTVIFVAALTVCLEGKPISYLKSSIPPFLFL